MLETVQITQKMPFALSTDYIYLKFLELSTGPKLHFENTLLLGGGSITGSDLFS